VLDGPDDAIAAVLSYETTTLEECAGEDWTPGLASDPTMTRRIKNGDYFFEGFAARPDAEPQLARLRKCVRNEGREHITVGIEEHTEPCAWMSNRDT
jgi:hypothetical protein